MIDWEDLRQDIIDHLTEIEYTFTEEEAEAWAAKHLHHISDSMYDAYNAYFKKHIPSH